MNGDAPVRLVTGTRSRFSFRFTPDCTRLCIPGLVVGSYLLLDDGAPVYIGRSDTCLRTRLERHPLLGRATHVTWQPTSSAERAYLIEAVWFHDMYQQDGVLNVIHPAKPAGSRLRCPFCAADEAEQRALLTALPPWPEPTRGMPMAA